MNGAGYHPCGRPPSPPRRPRSCKACAEGKAKCVFQAENIGKHCDRCHKQKIDCVPQPGRALRRAWRIKTNASAPGSSSQPAPAGATPSNPVHVVDGPAPGPSSGGPSSATATVPAPPDPPGPPARFRPPPEQSSRRPVVAHEAAPALSPDPGYGITWQQAELAVADYKQNFMPHFPFVPLEPQLTAQELWLRCRFLFRTVVVAAGRLPMEKRTSLKTNAMAYLGTNLLVSEERKFDLLQGLLVLIAWCEPQFYLDRSPTHLIHLAVGYAHNLSITKVRSPYGGKDRPQQDGPPHPHTLRQQRAFLGCYYLASVNAAQFGRPNDSLRGAQVDAACDSLHRGGLLELDRNLVKMVRLQQMVDEVLDIFGRNHDRRFSDNSLLAELASEQMKALRARLDGIAGAVDRPSYNALIGAHGPGQHRTISQQQQQQRRRREAASSSSQSLAAFCMKYNHVLVRIYETAMRIADPTTVPATAEAEGETQPQPSRRVQRLLSCLEAAKSYFSIVLSATQETHLFCSLPSNAELMHVIVSSARLLLLEAPGWDLRRAREALPLPTILDGLASQLLKAGEVDAERGGEVPESDRGAADKGRFARFADLVYWIKNWYRAREAGVETSAAPNQFEELSFPRDATVLGKQSHQHQFCIGVLGDASWHVDF